MCADVLLLCWLPQSTHGRHQPWSKMPSARSTPAPLHNCTLCRRSLPVSRCTGATLCPPQRRALLKSTEAALLETVKLGSEELSKV